MIQNITRLKAAFTGLNIGSIMLFRVSGLIVSFSTSLAIIAVLSASGSSQSFAAYALIASIVNLLPFADLGLGASVVNLTSDYRAGLVSEAAYRSGFRTSVGILTLISSVLVATLSIVYLQDSLDSILGSVASTSFAVEAFFISSMLVVLAIPLGLGARVLQGLGHVRTVAKVALVGPVLQALFILPVLTTSSPPESLFLAPASAYFVVAIWQFCLSQRVVARSRMQVNAVGPRSSEPVRLFATAVPFLLISVALTISFQSHRIMLANIATATIVAQYAAAAQFVGPLVALVALVAQNLWSTYRADTTSAAIKGRKFSAHLLGFAGIGTTFAVGFAVVAPILVRIVSGDVLVIPAGLIFSGALYIIISAVHQPSAMYLTNSSGLWMQAFMTFLVAVVTVACVLTLTDAVGAASPYLSLSVSMLILQVIPSYIIVRRRIAQGK